VSARSAARAVILFDPLMSVNALVRELRRE
jgi:hypothetical protein